MTLSWHACPIGLSLVEGAANVLAQSQGTRSSAFGPVTNAVSRGSREEEMKALFSVNQRAYLRRTKSRASAFSLPRKRISGTFWAAVGAPSQPPATSGFNLADGQSRMFHKLPSGLRLEVIFQLAQQQGPTGKPPIVFIHGSYHAAWCWAVHWLSFFSDRGHDCYAISLLAQGGSDTPSAKVAGDLQSHARDVAHFIQSNLSSAPVLVGHSFGGLLVQYYMSQMTSLFERPSTVLAEDHFPRLAAAILACSVPPTGNGGIVQRYIMTKPITAIKVTLSLAAKAFANSLSLCRDSFFSADMPDDQVRRYQELLKDSSRLPLFDLRKLNSSLPVAIDPSTKSLPLLVVGAENDFLVDPEGICETQRFYGVPKHVIPGVAHDVMLDVRWDRAAGVLANWIASLTLPSDAL